MKKRNPNLIREGDRVRIITPQVVVRVGYPKEVKDYVPEAEKLFGEQLRKAIRYDWAVDKALHQIAYGMAKTDGFGGRERSLHLKEDPELLGQEFTVTSVRMVQTGTYYPPHSWSGWTDSGYDYDYEPGGLENMKARRLVQGFQRFFTRIDEGGREIPVEHLEKLS